MAEAVGGGELQAFADDRAFVQQLQETTDGLPLYLTFLLDDLQRAAKQGKDVRQALAQTPKGFSEYVKKQLKELAPLVKKEQAVRTLVAVLSVAKGTLRESELGALTDLLAWDLTDLPYQATRWWHIGERDGEHTYAFTHTLLATEFAKALGEEAEAAKQKLLAWCARWREHQSIYALRHYIAHLIDLGNLAKAVETLTDVEFIETRCRTDLLQRHWQEWRQATGSTSNNCCCPAPTTWMPPTGCAACWRGFIPSRQQRWWR